jgi:SAM-dependent methyltransferase
MTTAREHWASVYETRPPDQVSWYRPHLERSLRFIEGAAPGADAAIIDVGGGASTLVDDLLDRGYTNVTVLDVAAPAIEAAKARLGERAARVHWLAADITQVDLAADGYDLWHDRAVFHFLREEADRRRYVAAAARAVKPGGHLVIATFGPEGPPRCSGLEVARYGAADLSAQFGADFRMVDSAIEIHTTPHGAAQQFVYYLGQRAG